MKDVKDIRITDPYIRRRVEAARRKAGESTSTRTAGRLILERLAQLEDADRPDDPDRHPADAAEPAGVGA